MNKPYFTKYLPIEGEIKEGDIVQGNYSNITTIDKVKKINSLGNNSILLENGNDVTPDTLKKLKLFLCSRDIQVGDKVWDNELNERGICTSTSDWTHKEGRTIVLNDDPNGGASSHYYFKVIGEISPEAIWVKEGDEFDEEDLKWIIDTSFGDDNSSTMYPLAYNLKTIFDKTKNDDGWGYVRNEIIDRVSELTVECPECESIIHSDEQYQCGTCGGGGRIFVLSWIKAELEHVK